jgi:hypothetical protein
MNIKPVPVPPEQTAFKKGVPMSQQLRQEREIVEKSAIKHKATPDELGEPRKRGRKPGGTNKPKPDARINKGLDWIPSEFVRHASEVLTMNIHDKVKIKFLANIIAMHEAGEL